MNKLIDFIKNNDLSFKEGRRNSDITVICGYALHLDEYHDWERDIKEAIIEVHGEGIWSDFMEEEVYRVFDFAYNNNYGDWWSSDEAKEKYVY